MMQILVLMGLVRLLMFIENPLLCSGIYTTIVFIFDLVFGSPFSRIVMHSAIAFAFSFAYFWLLDRFTDSGIIWWVIFAGGVLIGII